MPKKRIYLSPPDIGIKEKEYVLEAFDTNWIAPIGPHINAFEIELSNYIGTNNCAVLSSGTAALHLALILLGIEQGDEVICQSFTFCGSVNPIVYQKATPILIDSEMETWNMDPDLLEEAIIERMNNGKKPKAIIYVHLYGMPAKIDEILEIAEKYEIHVIEDAAEALGSEYNRKKVGQFGDMSILSFNGNKIITTSGGGALLSSNDEYIRKAKFLATQARDEAVHYQHSEIGYNYRLSNVSAAIGRGQLNNIEDKVNRRIEIFKIYKGELNNYEEISFHEEPNNTVSNRWLTTVLLNSNSTKKEKIIHALEKENIESRPLWKPMHLQPVYKNAPVYENGISESLFNKGLCLPSGSGMSDEDLERVIEVVKRCFS